MTRFFYIALLTLIGFFLTPTDTYACGSKSENIENTCTKQSNTETEKKDCCDTEKGQCGKHGKDCDGKCGNPACHCPTNCTNFTITFFDGFSGITIIVNKPNFYYQDTYYSSGFLSIWQPPKIG
mgnify:FL=1